MPREPIPTFFVALVVVKLGRRFLVVRENKKGQRWYLPAGHVEPGETIADAAVRETWEEAGIPIELEGVLRIEHDPSRKGSTRLRVIFLARPADDSPPKSRPDRESLEARWVTLSELKNLEVRSPVVRRLFKEVLAGAPVYPLSLLRPKNEPLLP